MPISKLNGPASPHRHRQQPCLQCPRSIPVQGTVITSATQSSPRPTTSHHSRHTAHHHDHLYHYNHLRNLLDCSRPYPVWSSYEMHSITYSQEAPNFPPVNPSPTSIHRDALCANLLRQPHLHSGMVPYTLYPIPYNYPKP